MNLFFRLKREEKGAAALEFALVAPALILFIVGIAQFGVLFMANNGLSNAVGEGARYATIYPRPTNAQITQRLTDGRFGLKSANISGPTYSTGVSAGIFRASSSVGTTAAPFCTRTCPPLITRSPDLTPFVTATLPSKRVDTSTKVCTAL